MLKFKCRIGIVALVILFVSALTLTAQPYGDMQGNGRKVKERISQIKKMKLLDILDLDEASADKFLIKYSAWEKKIEAQRDKIQIALDDLQLTLKSSKDKSAITKKTNAVISLQDDMMKLMKDMRADLKNVLDEVQYAKYLLFEHNFRREMGKMLMKRMHGKKQGKGMRK